MEYKKPVQVNSTDQRSYEHQIDHTSVDYDNLVSGQVAGGYKLLMELLASGNKNRISDRIRLWIKEVEHYGVTLACPTTDSEEERNDNHQSHQEAIGNDNKNFHDDERGCFVVHDPFCTLETDEDIVHIRHEDGDVVEEGLGGYCTIYLSNGYELSGDWHKRRREGAGLIGGAPLEQMGIKCIWGRYKKGRLNGNGRAELLDDCTLEGTFVDGRLHGPVRGLTARGRLAWAGWFRHGRPYGPSWRGLHGGAFLYGTVGSNGKWEGKNNAYIYPDLETALYGTFQDGQMVEARPVTITHAFLEERKSFLLRLRFSKPQWTDSAFKFWPSTVNSVLVPPLQQDPLESKLVYAGKSKMSDGAGDGLFLKRAVPANTTVAFYNGIRVKPGEIPPYSSTGYQIYVDWNGKKTVTSDYMDIPPEYASLSNYRASLGHKINHSFAPNCRWGTIFHATFGRIPRVVTITDLPADTELTCHYMIDMAEAAEDLENLQWYVDLWETFSNGQKENCMVEEKKENNKQQG